MKSTNSLIINNRLPPPESNLKTSNYKIMIFRKVIICVCLFVLVLIFFILDISTGAAHLSFMDVVTALLNPLSAPAQTGVIVNVIRLPIALMAILVGASLAIAGTEMQTILNNPLASPYTLGISSASTFGASLSLMFGVPALPIIFQNITTPLFSFAFSLASSLLIFTIGKRRAGKSTIILAGIAVNFMFTALLSILTFFANDQILRGITNWSQGNILGATLQQDLIVFVVVAAVTPFLLKNSWKLTALCMGDSTARSLGIQVDKLRIKMLILTSVITAIAVSFVGTIGFIGLVAPYIAKRLIGEEQRFFIPASLMTGAAMLSASSILSKTVITGCQIPLGIVTSIIGIPFLLMLILRKAR